MEVPTSSNSLPTTKTAQVEVSKTARFVDAMEERGGIPMSTTQTVGMEADQVTALQFEVISLENQAKEGRLKLLNNEILNLQREVDELKEKLKEALDDQKAEFDRRMEQHRVSTESHLNEQKTEFQKINNRLEAKVKKGEQKIKDLEDQKVKLQKEWEKRGLQLQNEWEDQILQLHKELEEEKIKCKEQLDLQRNQFTDLMAEKEAELDKRKKDSVVVRVDRDNAEVARNPQPTNLRTPQVAKVGHSNIMEVDPVPAVLIHDDHETALNMKFDLAGGGERESIRKAHVFIALNQIFPKWAGELKDLFSEAELALSEDGNKIIPIGVVRKLRNEGTGGNDSTHDVYRFVHTLHAEYLIAQFITDCLVTFHGEKDFRIHLRQISKFLFSEILRPSHCENTLILETRGDIYFFLEIL